MKTELIVMLTHNDKTVPNALETFESAKDLDVRCWGFKDVGLPEPEMVELIAALKAAGKTTFLEVVSYGEEECMRGAELAVRLGFDCLMGTLFYPAVWEYLKKNNVKYMPFVGKVSGSPSILEGTIEEIIEEGRQIAAQGVYGFDILAYRYVAGNPEQLAKEFIAAMDVPVVVAGSINGEQRMQFVEDIGAYGFTMGGALFEGKFAPGGTFRENLQAVRDMMDTIS